MPSELRDACAKYPDANPLRIWATALSAYALMLMEESWLVNRDDEPDETIVDRAQSWINRQAVQFPEVAAVIPDVRRKADATVRFWNVHQLLATQEVRRAERAGRFRKTNEALRLAGHLVRTLRTKHETMSICFGSPEDRVQRYQRTLVVFTLILAGFAVEIWCERGGL